MYSSTTDWFKASLWRPDATACDHRAELLATSADSASRRASKATDLGLTTAAHGTFTLTPTPAMRDALRADYVAMAGMIFGDVPPLDAVLASIEEIERRMNG